MGSKSTFRDTTEARHAFRRAPAPLPEELAGDWRLEFIGNDAWQRLLGWSERALGLHGLWGLRFEGTVVHHLVGKPRRGLKEVQPLTVDLGPSSVDHAPTVTCTPPAGSGGLWALLRCEVRLLDRDRLIGVDVIGPASLRVPMPFVLHRHKS